MTLTDVEKAKEAAAAPADETGAMSNRALMAEVRRRYARGEIRDNRFDFLHSYDFEGIEDAHALTEAVHRWQRREYRETLYQLERALGRDFMGLGDMKPEDLR
jgi:hypothetical protein